MPADHPAEFVERERSIFEAWARSAYQWGDAEFEQSPYVVPPHYKVGQTFSMFKAWLAARSTAVEITEDMVEAGARAMTELHLQDGITFEALVADPEVREYLDCQRVEAKACITAALEVRNE